MAVCQDKVLITIIVVVEELETPAAQKPGCLSDFTRPVNECQVFLVVVETEEFLIDVGNAEILPAITIKVSCVHTHARARVAGIAIAYARRQPDLFKLTFALVDEEKVGDRVVGNKEVDQAIAIDIGGNCSEGLARRVG